MGGIIMLKRLTYLGHSCFQIEAENGWTAVLDPYRTGSVPGLSLPSAEADAVFCSHDHADHCGAEQIRIREGGPKCPYSVKTILTDHDDKGGSLRGKNLVLVLSCGNEKIIHLGDLGCIPEEGILDQLKDADILMIPCGGYYTIDADEAKNLIETLAPKLAVLMHFRSDGRGYDVLSDEADICRRIPGTVVTGASELIPGEYEGIVILEPKQ